MRHFRVSRNFFTMFQDLYDRWTEIQKGTSEGQPAGHERDRIAEELNILEALRILNCKKIPGETSDIETLIKDRHRLLDNSLRKRKQ